MVTFGGLWRLAGAALTVAVGVPASNAFASCDHVLPSASEAAQGPKRGIIAADLLGLRDIGYPDAAVSSAPPPFGLSPDRRSVAFVINQADVTANAYCRALVVLPTGGGAPRIVDRGGEFLQGPDDVRGLLANYGISKVAAPAWSPDGRDIAYLKRTDGHTQIWLVDVEHATARALTASPVDVEAFAWSADGRTIVYTARPQEAVVERAVDREGRSGWLYDDRMTPNAGARPRLRTAEVPLATFALDVHTGAVRAASPSERETIAAAARRSAALEADLGEQQRARLVATTLLGPTRILVDRNGATVPCRDPVCSGNVGGVWRGDDGSLVFLRREGWLHELTTLYRWRPGAAEATRILATDDVLTGCVVAPAAMICGRENAAMPRRVARIDLRTGASRTLFDPNPAFVAIELGSVTRLKWRNDRVLETWGDFVLPPHYHAGTKLPMIVVQYHSRGFLRGGTNDEYPIYLFAARGFAVLSLERPPAVASIMTGLTTAAAANAANFKDWADRRSIQSSIEEGVRQAVATGTVDPTRLGITGLSDGAASVRFALINSTLFAAAALSTCCVEPVTAMTLDGPRFADFNRAMGFPDVGTADPAFWSPMSLATNAARITTPLLMQLSDDEYLLALEAFEALRERDQPVEMYVYPDEHHAKWQPVHRQAVYDRNLDWFAFWLQSVADPSPAKQEQYRRWEAMRDRLQRR